MFMEATDFEFLAPLQSNWRTILDELLLLNDTYFLSWPERDIYKGDWKVFGLYKFGVRLDDSCNLCPLTAKMLDEIPGIQTAGFSSLAANTHITPHCGYTNQVLRYHLGLITPKDCALRVGKEVRAWSAGSCFVFDDTNEHEAWNRSDSTRVVLLLDFKRDVQAEVVYPEEILKYDLKFA